MSDDGMEDAVAQMFATLGGAISELQSQALGMDQVEYALVPWAEVNVRARDRWRLVRMPPVPGDAAVLFIMERQILADEASLAAVLSGVPGG